MNLLYKECEVCGTKIHKLQSWWNIYTLKAGKTLICSKCNTEYKTSRLISFIGSFYTYSGISIFILLSMVELLLMVLLPLKKIGNKE